MSEQFEAGLRDLYAAAEMAHDAQPGLAVDLMVARTRRHRRARTAAVTMATAAAVVGVAVAGTAVVNNLDDPTAPPADGPTSSATSDPVAGTVTEPTCGTALADLTTVPADRGMTLSMGLDTTDLAAGDLTGWLGTGLAAGTAATSWRPVDGGGIPESYRFVVVQDGVVVGTTLPDLRPADPQDGDPRTHEARIVTVACDGGALVPGTYDLVAYLPLQLEAGPEQWAPAVLVSDPVPFTVPDAGPLPDPQEHYVPDGASAIPPTDAAAPLPDGNYLAHVSEIDAAAGTVSADVVVLYFGSAAEAWVAAHAPGTEILDGYVSDDPDGQVDRVVPLAPDMPVWEVCWGPSSEEKVQRTGGVAEWATAPLEDGESLCEDTSTIPVGGMYWLDIRGGQVRQAVGQFLP